MNYPPPKSGTDFQSLGNTPDYDIAAKAAEEAAQAKAQTDFHALSKQMPVDVRPYQHRSGTDYLIDILTPLMIGVMMYTIIYFLLDVRYVSTAVHDTNFRVVAFFFILGVVALNRLIARDGSGESMLYTVALVGMVGFYTFSTTSLYDVGSVARKFMNHPFIATFFNMTVAAFLWWLTNRLLHECCIDENTTAGDVGILTGTARKIQKAIGGKEPSPADARRKRQKNQVIETMIIEPFDPLAWKPQEDKPSAFDTQAPSKPLAKRHPGISIFYFSVPVMFIFAVGLPYIMHGGRPWILAGHFYVVVFTVAALSLLMLTSLGGLREYFRSRRIRFPTGIGWFWIGLGVVMIAFVCLGAFQLPHPGLPGLANVDEHEADPWARNSTFALKSVAATAAESLDQSRFVQRLGIGVLICLGLFLLYGLLRGIGGIAAAIGRSRHRFPRFVVRFFGWLDAFLLRFMRLPEMPKFRRTPRIDRHIATCTHHQNPLAGQGTASREEVEHFIALSYEALCALAYDLGVPRADGQTPYEFIRAFPKALKGLKDEALELTGLYVRSAYSDEALDPRTLDRLRRFWIAYERARRRVVK